MKFFVRASRCTDEAETPPTHAFVIARLKIEHKIVVRTELSDESCPEVRRILSWENDEVTFSGDLLDLSMVAEHSTERDSDEKTLPGEKTFRY